MEQFVGNRYELLEKLGEGGMGVVYRAMDRLSGQAVAVKCVQTHPEAAEFVSPTTDEERRLTLAREFQVMASLRHPNIVTVIDYGFDEERQPYLVMELVENAQDIRKASKLLPLPARVELLIQLLQAVAYLHRRGIMHRDLKPGNVLVANEQVQVLDFGLATDANQVVGKLMGTIHYMAPEFLMGERITSAFDLYAVGVIAYEVLTRKRLYSAENDMLLLNQIVHEPADLSLLQKIITQTQKTVADENGAFPPHYEKLSALVPILTKLLAKSPEDRYQQAETVIEDLGAALQQPPPPETTAMREGALQYAQFIGREAELDQLTAALEQITESDPSQGGVWLIGGESGVGKSRLMDELRIRALVQGAIVARGQCVAEGGAPYQLWREPLRRLVLSCPCSDLEASILVEHVPDLERLLERSIRPAPDLEGRQAHQRFMDTVVEMFKRQPEPILILLEDLQWIGEESLDLLATLYHHIQSLPVLLVGNYREGEQGALLTTLDGCHHLHLGRLNTENIADLSHALLGDIGHQPEVVDFLQRETEGNVFFLIEVVRYLAESAGALGSIGSVTIPASVFAGGIQRIVQHRLDRIAADYRPLLKLAAVIGRRLDVNLLEKANSDFLNRLGNGVEAVDMRVWLFVGADALVLHTEDGFWQFAHDKLREGLLAELDGVERRQLHQLAAELIEATYPNDPSYKASLLEHWHLAGHVEKEAHYAVQVGLEALEVGNEAEALHAARRAINQLEWDHPARIALLQIVGHVYSRRNRMGEALTYYFESLQLAQSQHDPLGRAGALVAISSALWHEGEYERARGYAEEALRLAEIANDVELITSNLIVLGNILSDLGQYEPSMACYLRSFAVAREHHLKYWLGVTLNNLGWRSVELGNYDVARDYLEQSLAIKKALGNQRSTALAYMNLGKLAFRQRNLADTQHYYEASLQIYERLRDPWGMGKVWQYMGEMYLHTGEIRKSQQFRDKAIDIFRKLDNRPALVMMLLDFGFASLDNQDSEGAWHYLVEAVQIARDSHAVPRLVESIIGFAYWWLLHGDMMYAAQLIGLAANHPALTPDIERNRLRGVLGRLEKALPADTLDDLLTQGHNLALDGVIQTLLMNDTTQNLSS